MPAKKTKKVKKAKKAPQAKTKKTTGKKSPKNTLGQVVFTELNTPDISRAAQFYNQVLDLEQKEIEIGPGQKYSILHSANHDVAGVVQSKAGQPAMFIQYHRVADARATAARVKENAGKILVEPTQIATGTFAILQDPMGAVFGILEPKSK